MKSPVLPWTVSTGTTISGDVAAGASAEFGTFFWFTVTVSTNSCVTKIVVAVNISYLDVLENFVLPLYRSWKGNTRCLVIQMGGVAGIAATGFRFHQHRLIGSFLISDLR